MKWESKFVEKSKAAKKMVVDKTMLKHGIADRAALPAVHLVFSSCCAFEALTRNCKNCKIFQMDVNLLRVKVNGFTPHSSETNVLHWLWIANALFDGEKLQLHSVVASLQWLVAISHVFLWLSKALKR